MADRNTPRKRRRPPPVLKARAGVVRMTSPAKISLGETYMTACSKAAPPLGAKLATQSAVVKQMHDALVKKIAEVKFLEDSLMVKRSEATAAVKSYEAALQDYALGAVKVVDGDVIALQTLGVTPAATTRSRIIGPPSAPEKLRLSPGPAPGSLVIKHSRPTRAGSFAVEYKLEPSQPEDPWKAPEALQSRAPAHQLNGLLPGQLVRVRVRALGDGWGPYSEEVLGRAR